MDEAFGRKYKKVLEVLPDVAECAGGRLILVGGTALALFHLNHRISVDLDFVPVTGSDIKLKEELKGCLSKRGYHTIAGAFRNQFVVQFEDSSIKVEVFEPAARIKRVEERSYGTAKIMVASIDDIFEMKLAAYADRKEARDLFDIFCIRKAKGDAPEVIRKLVSKAGPAKNVKEVENTARSLADLNRFKKVVSDASA